MAMDVVDGTIRHLGSAVIFRDARTFSILEVSDKLIQDVRVSEKLSNYLYKAMSEGRNVKLFIS